MGTPRTTQRLAAILRALADPTRLRIVGLLLGGEVCVCDIHESLHIPQPRASRHLGYLRRAGLVNARKQGLWVHYRLADLPDPVIATLVAAVSHCLTHLEATGQDQKRLARKTGCCAASVTPASTLPCCVPAVPSASEEHSSTRR